MPQLQQVHTGEEIKALLHSDLFYHEVMKGLKAPEYSALFL